MLRICNGSDPNLVMYTDSSGKKLRRGGSESQKKPCNCGLRFDDARRRVIWPHEEF